MGGELAATSDVRETGRGAYTQRRKREVKKARPGVSRITHQLMHPIPVADAATR
jgi:hypothetical protein